MIHLRFYDKYPPDGFTYHDSNGPGRDFPAIGGIRLLATTLSEYRTANNFPDAGWEACFRDIEVFTCNRLNNDPKWVQDSEAEQYVAPRRQRNSGGCCGAKVT